MGLFSIFSSRRGRSAPPDHPFRDTDAWKPGDLAECVYPGPWFNLMGGPCHRIGPKLGERFVVSEVRPSAFPGLSLLSFVRFAPRQYASTAFRKITPRADEAVAGTAATVEQLLDTPVRVPAPAPELVE